MMSTLEGYNDQGSKVVLGLVGTLERGVVNGRNDEHAGRRGAEQARRYGEHAGRSGDENIWKVGVAEGEVAG